MNIVPGYEKLTKDGIVSVETASLMEQIRREASSRVMAGMKGRRFGLIEFYDKLTTEGLVVWLEFFPRICEELRHVNHEKRKILQETSNKGKFTDSYGWSANGDWRSSWEYTPEFFFFMKNFVYSWFFEREEHRVRERFMRRIMAGYDAMDELVKLKKRYGSNKQEAEVVSGGTRN